MWPENNYNYRRWLAINTLEDDDGYYTADEDDVLPIEVPQRAFEENEAPVYYQAEDWDVELDNIEAFQQLPDSF